MGLPNSNASGATIGDRSSRADRSRSDNGPSIGERGTRPSMNRPTHTEEPRQSGGSNDAGSSPRRPDDARPSRPGDGQGRTDRSDRRNPFDRQTDRTGDNRTRNDQGSVGRSEGGSNDRILFGDRPSRSDRGRSSRSGDVAYGSYHNGYGELRPTRYGGGFNHAELGRNVHRSRPSGASFVFGGVYGGLRYGYVGYSSSWRDDNFCYPFYVFDPWAPNVAYVASPWYRYSYLPPYLNTSRVVVIDHYDSDWGSTDGWRDYDDRARRNEDIDNALDDIRDAFERGNDRLADRILPRTGQVAIFNDGKYDYSLGVDDFQDMFVDGIAQSKTIRYEIIESRVKGNEVHLRARHEYTDSWGESQVVFHTYTLRREQGGRYVIREFGTD